MGFYKTKTTITEGPIFGKMLLYVLPIMATAILQLLYNMADHMVVGQFSGDADALAAVGSTTSLTNLIVNLFMGITAGAGVVVARAFGAKDDETLGKAVHTSMLFSVIGGVIFAIIGLAASAPALSLMGTKPEILDKAVLYMRIICLGVPATAVYNFGATILRSVGDSNTPLYVLSTSGLVNVVLNLFFVIVCNMSVEGVALATIASQYISAIAVVIILKLRRESAYALNFSKLTIDKRQLILVLKLGIPAGIQSSLFSISNVILTAAVNTFSTAMVTAKTIAGNIDGILYSTLNSYLHASMTFVAQNYGAAKPDRIKKSIFTALIQVIVIGISLGLLMLFIGRDFASVFIESSTPDKDIVLDGVMSMLWVTVLFYFLCGIMETLSGALRGLGNSFAPMLISVAGICGMRILWVLLFFPMERFNSLAGLYYCYPISWGTTALVLGITLIFTMRKLGRIFRGSAPLPPV